MKKTTVTRREWFAATALGATAIATARSGSSASAANQAASAVRDVGSRRELFVDRFLIDRMETATLKLYEPQLALAMSQPADNLEYGTVIKDGDLFRLYTRDGRGAKFDGDATEVTRYCESCDGIHRTKPKPGLHEVDGKWWGKMAFGRSFNCRPAGIGAFATRGRLL
jgi:hypothetical protein